MGMWLDDTNLGTNTGTANGSIDRTNWNTNLRFGGPGSLTRMYSGQLDEVRISNIARSDEWIETEFNNQSSPGTFFTITSGASINPCGPLPIELLFFRGTNIGESTVLSWATSSELNNDYFTLQRSTDGKTFIELGTVVGAGNSKTRLDYEFVDRRPETGLNYYRLKQTDFDGSFSYSKLISVNSNTDFTEEIRLYPNPNKGDFSIRMTTASDHPVTISVLDEAGKTLTTLVKTPMGHLEHNFQNFPKGVYFIKITSEYQQTVKKVIVK